MTDEPGGAPVRLDLIDALDTRLDEAAAVRLARVLRALADAGLIDEWHVFVEASRP